MLIAQVLGNHVILFSIISVLLPDLVSGDGSQGRRLKDDLVFARA